MTVGAGDTMTGGGGAGTFVFKAVLSTPATITDFTSGADSLQIVACLTAGGSFDKKASSYRDNVRRTEYPEAN